MMPEEVLKDNMAKERFLPHGSRRRSTSTAMAYTISLPSVGNGNSGFTSWANSWGDVFNDTGSVAAPTYTGSDGLVNTPMDGVFRLGAHFDSSVIRMWTTQDTLIGSFDPNP